MRRREFIGLIGGAAAWPVAARAQEAGSVRRVGVLSSLSETDNQAQAELSALRQGLASLGWSEDQNLKIEVAFDLLNEEKRRSAVNRLIASGPSVIVTRGTPVTAAVVRETHAIPIVFANVSDPVGSSFAASLSRPGGNVTGFSNFEASLATKWLALLKEAFPHLSRFAALFDPKTAVDDGRYFLAPLETAGRELQFEVVPTPVQEVSQIGPALHDLARTPNTGLIVIPNAFNTVNRRLIVAAAAQHRLPAIYASKDAVRSGGLLFYGVDSLSMWLGAARYVHRILKGEKAADLPVQAPVKFDLVVNLKTAKEIGLTIPEAFLLRADEVIE